MIYLSAGVYMVVENFHPHNLVRGTYYFHQAIYFIMVTFSTIGYGEYYPLSEEGKLLMIGIIAFVMVVTFGEQINKLVVLMNLKSSYQQDLYISNPEVEHVVITGHVKLAALRNVAFELFHEEHGSDERYAVIL
jgi:acetyl-CoA C-acetyltransferase/potassium large conductance calcium-activated channel subfamily M alpha protein 1